MARPKITSLAHGPKRQCYSRLTKGNAGESTCSIIHSLFYYQWIVFFRVYLHYCCHRTCVCVSLIYRSLKLGLNSLASHRVQRLIWSCQQGSSHRSRFNMDSHKVCMHCIVKFVRWRIDVIYAMC